MTPILQHGNSRKLNCHSYKWGLGRHFYYLSPLERNQAMRWDFASQPLGKLQSTAVYKTSADCHAAVAASMWSRTGMMLFLYTCFAVQNKRTRWVLIGCMVVQIIVNSFTIVQIVVQCGPNPYRTVRLSSFLFFHLNAFTDCKLVQPNGIFPLHVGSSPY